MIEIVERAIIVNPSLDAQVIEKIREKAGVALVLAESEQREIVGLGQPLQPLDEDVARRRRETGGFEPDVLDRHAEEQRLRVQFLECAQEQFRIGPLPGFPDALQKHFVARTLGPDLPGLLPLGLDDAVDHLRRAFDEAAPIGREPHPPPEAVRRIRGVLLIQNVQRRLHMILRPSDGVVQIAEGTQKTVNGAIGGGVAREPFERRLQQPVVLQRLGKSEHPPGDIAFQLGAERSAKSQLVSLHRGEIPRVLPGVENLLEKEPRRNGVRHFATRDARPDRRHLL